MTILVFAFVNLHNDNLYKKVYRSLKHIFHRLTFKV